MGPVETHTHSYALMRRHSLIRKNFYTSRLLSFAKVGSTSPWHQRESLSGCNMGGNGVVLLPSTMCLGQEKVMRTTAGVTCFSCACAVNTSREGRLEWHSGLIPQMSNRGDKGMKTSFQICNVPHPNSYKIFSIFDAGNTATNLNIALASFRPQVNSRERDMAVCMLMHHMPY